MLEVNRQSAGFTPHDPLYRIPSGDVTGVEFLESFHWGLVFYKKVFSKAPLSVGGVF